MMQNGQLSAICTRGFSSTWCLALRRWLSVGFLRGGTRLLLVVRRAFLRAPLGDYTVFSAPLDA